MPAKRSSQGGTEQLRFLSENLSEGMLYQIDTGPDGRQRQFTYLSAAVERMHGLPLSEARRDPMLVYNQVCEEDRVLLERAEAKAFESKTKLCMDVRVRLPSGEIRWRRFVSVPRKGPTGTLVWDGFELDITELKDAEIRLRDERERLAVTLRSIGDGVIATDTRGRITIMNRVAEELTGWSQAEVKGMPLAPVFQIVDAVTGESRGGLIQRVLADNLAAEFPNQTLLVARTGSRRIIAGSGAPILDAENRMIGAVLAFRDRTEKVRFTEQARRAEKLGSLGILAGGIAHDFSNLLGSIFSHIDLALSLSPGKEVEEYLRMVLDTMGRARGLTKQLLNFAKGGAPVRRPEPLFPFVEHTVRFALRGGRVNCRFDIDPTLWWCNYDTDQIGQVVDNLVINAQRAMPSGGDILVSAKNCTLDDDEHPVLSAGRYVRLSFQDTGIGIPKALLPRIFEPFFTTREKGSGLGLAMCHSIVERHGGTIDVESDPGKGTAFHVYLPAAVRIEPESSGARGGLAPPSAKILLMEDHPAIRSTVSRMIERLGHTCDCAVDGDGAIQAYMGASAAGRPYSLIILDLMIPGAMGGKETLCGIRKLDPDVPVVVMSGYAEHPVMVSPRDHGFSDGIGKPFTMVQFSEFIARNLALAPAASGKRPPGT